METVFSIPLLRREKRADAEEWLAAARLGEPWALERMYHSYHPQIYALCHRLLGRCEDAQDATQMVFIRAFRDVSRFRGDSALKTWLYKIAVNEAVGLLRRRRDTSELAEDCARVPDGASTVVDRLAVHSALARTAPAHRAILVLRFWEGLDYEEMAAVLGISLAAAKMRLHRARMEFRKRYEEEA
ncbi:MAG TPA: sigma-70 family RNA polymerase sigma factor [Armatimonadota bacterium]|nr:sigma-70 family RNA polymerase sigma factor [Armatimonadota bacterium]